MSAVQGEEPEVVTPGGYGVVDRTYPEGLGQEESAVAVVELEETSYAAWAQARFQQTLNSQRRQQHRQN